MNPKVTKRKGFTLLEILIATAVFSTVMVITTSVVAQSVNYQSKLKVSREVFEESRYISDTLSRNIRTADGSFKVKYVSADPLVYSFQNGLALMSCVTTNWSCQFVNYTNEEDTTGLTGYFDDLLQYQANTMILLSKDTFNFYSTVDGSLIVRSVSKEELIEDGFFTESDNTLLLTNIVSESVLESVNPTDGTVLSDIKVEDKVNFTGYTAEADGPILQTYIGFYVHSRTKDFDDLGLTERAETFIRSLVATRNYKR